MAVASPLLLLHPAGFDQGLALSLFAHLSHLALEPENAAGLASPATATLAVHLMGLLLAPGAPSRAPILAVLAPKPPSVRESTQEKNHFDHQSALAVEGLIPRKFGTFQGGVLLPPLSPPGALVYADSRRPCA